MADQPEDIRQELINLIIEWSAKRQLSPAMTIGVMAGIIQETLGQFPKEIHKKSMDHLIDVFRKSYYERSK